MSSGFISEGDIELRKRQRQENWEKTRQEDDPLEAPEEPIIDCRPLYHRLEEQRLKKQEEWEESHKLKNMIRGLEDDEVDFLDFVDRTKFEEEMRVKKEESSELEEFRKRVSEMQRTAQEEECNELLSTDSRKPRPDRPKKQSALSLLAGAIKRKHDDMNEGKETEEEDVQQKPNTEVSQQKPDTEVASTGGAEALERATHQCVGVIPGLGNYSDSSEEDSSDSSCDLDGLSERGHRDLTGRMVKIGSTHSGSSSHQSGSTE